MIINTLLLAIVSLQTWHLYKLYRFITKVSDELYAAEMISIDLPTVQSMIDRKVDPIKREVESAIKQGNEHREEVVGIPSNENTDDFLNAFFGAGAVVRPTVLERLTGLEDHLGVKYEVSKTETKGYVKKSAKSH